MRLASFDAGSMVTAATVSDDGKRLLLLTYEYLHQFELSGAAAQMLAGPHRKMLIEARQCEAVCFDGKSILVANEQREIYRIEPNHWRDVLLPAAPQHAVRMVVDTPLADITWQEVALATLEADYIEGQLPTGPPPRLKLTCSQEALYCQVEWAAGVLPEHLREGWRISILVGPALQRQAMVANPADAAYEVSLGEAGWQVTRPGGEALAAGGALPTTIHTTSRLAVRIPLVPTLQNSDPLRVNVIIRQPAAEGFEEWAWGATSSTWPSDNALLWGRIDRQPSR